MTRGPGDESDFETHLRSHPLRVEARVQRVPRVSFEDRAGAHAHDIAATAIVGSASRADVVIDDPTVSRLHAELEPRDDGLWIRDLGSRNGTIVENVTVSAARLEHGMRVRVGGTTLVVSIGESTQAVDVWPLERFGVLLGRSRLMRELFARLAKIAANDATVLIHGETGTGKELVARAIHEASARASSPLVVVDCASLPENLLESELFGHVRGAFTGAVATRAGAMESAHGGTLFLDEIGELPLSMQPKLLRALETQSFRRIGESTYRKVDVRFIAATHRDLRAMVNAGAFREDLFFRLSVLPVSVPPLRARPEDVSLLIEHFLPAGAGSVFTAEVLGELSRLPWLGNVRELRNFVQRAIALGTADALSAGAPEAGATEAVPFPAAIFERPYKEAREWWIDEMERAYVRKLLERHKRNVADAAQEAGLDRTYLYKLIRKHDL